ncbi:MAG: thiolase family protein [Myxococcales bacterium]|nr:thiolase family protein [Myxococcales bacterium]
MRREVFVLGSSTTQFRRWPERTHRDLLREAYTAALEDAGVDPARVEGAWFGSAAMHHFGQANIRGQVAMAPLAREMPSGLYPQHAPIVNVEGGCATGALCLASACHAVAAGACDVAVAVGVEKVFMPEAPEKMLALFNGGMDQLHPEEWRALYTELAPSSGTSYAPRADRSAILDAVALGAAWHMKTYGTTLEALARVASKNHGHGVHNPNAQYREAMSVDAVLADKPVVFPFTRAMCAPMSDGAAAVLVGSAEALAGAPARAHPSRGARDGERRALTLRGRLGDARGRAAGLRARGHRSMQNTRSGGPRLDRVRRARRARGSRPLRPRRGRPVHRERGHGARRRAPREHLRRPRVEGSPARRVRPRDGA